MNENLITMGSIFDGIGAFPYAASFFGIKTLWASEIIPNAISVTRRHFPGMAHLGDVTKLNGGHIPPVRIIAFGSPCQSFSVAGNRTAFDGKSGLFFEAVRIIREMRCATNGKYPELVLFENVPGLLNVDSRRSYKTVLEAFCDAEIPMPVSGRWANAGMVRGRGVDLAWVIKDAQYHRTPQRRRRLFLIVDFAGRRAGEILFVSKSLSGYFAARGRERKGIAAHTEIGAGNTGGNENYGIGFDGYNCGLTGRLSATLGVNCGMSTGRNGILQGHVIAGAFMAGQAKNARSIAYSETISPTLKGSPSGLNQVPCVCELQSASQTLPVVYGICSVSSNSMKSSNPHSGIYRADTCRTLDRNGGAPSCNQGGMAVVERTPFGANDPVTVLNDQGGNSLSVEKSGRSPTLRNQAHGNLPVVSYPQIRMNSLNQGGVRYIVRRLTPTETERLMSLPDGWTEYGHDGKLMSDSVRYQMCGNSIVVNCLAYIMQNIAVLMAADGSTGGLRD